MDDFKHYTVMLHETVDALNCQSGKIYVDCTLGGGGHSELILQKIQPDGRLIAFDIDNDAIQHATERLKKYNNLTIVKSSYTNIRHELKKLGIEKITGGVILDLGASFHQLTKAERGFSFMKDAPLDMRFNTDADFSAYDVVNTYKEQDLVKIFSEYGEERFSKRIAKKIVETRKIKSIRTTGELASLIKEATPHIKSSVHPATRVFQAIRIEVNNELKNVNFVLHEILDLLDVGGIISVLSFHSLEDRIVKQFFKFESQRCRCNDLVCKCPPPKIEIVNKKPIMATVEEIKENSPSRSAKLRVVRCVS